VSEASGTEPGHDIVIITGPAGAGRSTAIGALEDLGFEAIDNLPMSLLPRLLAGPPLTRPLVVGIDPRNRDFAVARLVETLGEIAERAQRAPVLLYLDCDVNTLIRRYSETRRRHPLSPGGTPATGIEREMTLLGPLRDSADVLIDTTNLTPHELRAEMGRQFGPNEPGGGLAVSLHSFSYKRGTPGGIDMIIDVRFLRNPHWDAALRPLDGRDGAVAAFVRADPLFEPFYARLVDLLLFLLPAYRDEGKSYFSLGLGCTGGKHRSVTLVQMLAETLADDGWQVSIRHRDLERALAAAPGNGVVSA
jgi:RNase adapter protein RapZ